MLDATPIALQRTRGTAAIGFGPGGRLAWLYQQGSAKVMVPRSHGATPEAVFLNTAGGLTGGDRLSLSVDIAPGTHITATTQTAERAYASAGGVAEVDVTLRIGPGARLDWLPQETILFDSAALHRTTRIELAEGANCLFAEMLTLGRQAMGETVRSLDLLDRRIVTRAGVPLLVEPLRLTGLDLVSRSPAGLCGARALATIALVTPDAEDRLPGLRRAFPDATASAWDGRLVCRAMSPDPHRLRRDVAAIVEYLRGAALPRVWQI
ncbi:MAG: urease accessory protein UreD [Paracoccaceae bacterium]|nr:urease accessory protein UreD [Paracoccaceae bacterium]